jgi:CO/xanthine dehydrogenase Mo-binding subunit
MSAVKTRRDVLGISALRPDGVAKVKGEFDFTSDLHADNMLWGATLRSPHPYARLISIDYSAALKIDGVEAVVTADDVPGQLTYGLISSDQPVFAKDFVRYMGEPVAAVVADHPETCRRALAAIEVNYEVLTPLTNPEECLNTEIAPIHPDGNVIRRQQIVAGDVNATGPIVVEGDYIIGMQDQAF